MAQKLLKKIIKNNTIHSYLSHKYIPILLAENEKVHRVGSEIFAVPFSWKFLKLNCSIKLRKVQVHIAYKTNQFPRNIFFPTLPFQT